MGYFVKNRRLQSGSSGVVIPSGGSATRPLAPSFGLIRFNIDTGYVEFFNGIQYVNLANSGALNYTIDSFTGNDSQTVFTMSQQVSSASQIMVFVGSIYQDSTTAYTVNGGYDITFTSAPPYSEPISVIHSST
jgi:hypothetical protein